MEYGGSNSDTCDICGSHKDIKAGRWIFYCPKHEQNDRDMAWENEINPDLESGDLSHILDEPELQDMLI